MLPRAPVDVFSLAGWLHVAWMSGIAGCLVGSCLFCEVVQLQRSLLALFVGGGKRPLASECQPNNPTLGKRPKDSGCSVVASGPWLPITTSQLSTVPGHSSLPRSGSHKFIKARNCHSCSWTYRVRQMRGSNIGSASMGLSNPAKNKN